MESCGQRPQNAAYLYKVRRIVLCLSNVDTAKWDSKLRIGDALNRAIWRDDLNRPMLLEHSFLKMPNPKSFSRQAFVELGLRLSGNWDDHILETLSHSTKIERMKDFFYASPKTIKQIFRDIQHPDLGEYQIKRPDPNDFLCALFFLKKYPTKHALAGFLGCCEKAALEKTWRYVKAIQALKPKKIRWLFDQPGNETNEDIFILSVDGVHCRISEPRYLPSSGWYSCKFKKAGVVYEVAVSVYTDKICWTNGPFPAGQNDLRIFRKENGLMSRIPNGKRVIADEGYVGEPTKVSTRNEFDPPEVKELKKRAKARQESVNARLKSFGVLNQMFRTTGQARLEKHKAAFDACCVIVQYELDNGSSKLMKV